jgi:uncharacterized DUF497 family protein
MGRAVYTVVTSSPQSNLTAYSAEAMMPVRVARRESMEFEWDETKAEANLQKHGVSFTEAMTVFGDPLSLTAYDPDHSTTEDRYIIMGMSSENRLLVVSHTDRGDKIRVISARAATRRERKDYEDGNFP